MIKLKNGLKILCLILFCFCGKAEAQVRRVDSLVALGDSLHAEYSFIKSLEAYTMAMEELSDSLATVEDSVLRMAVKDRMLLSENGRNMMSFADSPRVVAKHKFSLDEFFLYYPLQDRSWRPVPNQLDSIGGEFARAIYAPEQLSTLY